MVPACILLAAALLPGASTPIGLTRYAHAVHSVRLSLDRERTSPTPSGIASIQGRLRRLSKVRLPGGRVVQTDLPVIARQLSPGGRSSILQAARTLHYLDSLLNTAGLRPARPGSLSALDALLRESQFHPTRTIWQQIGDKIAELRQRLIEWLAGNLRRRTGTFGAFAVLLLILVAGLGYLLARGALGRMVIDVAEDESDGPATASVAEERSQAARRAGDYREALRYLFLATMLGLQERGVLDLQPGLTNREYLRVVRNLRPNSAELRDTLNELVDVFDAVWYGHMPIDAERYERCQIVSERLLHATREAA